jgi:hypothetical protein
MVTSNDELRMESERTDSDSGAVKIALVTLGVGVVAGVAVWLWIMRTPLFVPGPGGPAGRMFDANTPEGRLFGSVSQCAERQKDLYLYIDAHVQKHGRVPADLDALLEDHPMTVKIFGCPSGGPYEIHLENFGDPNAVVIEERPDAHPNTVRLWMQGIRSQVRTMGDGVVRMFNKPNLATIQAKRN